MRNYPLLSLFACATISCAPPSNPANEKADHDNEPVSLAERSPQSTSIEVKPLDVTVDIAPAAATDLESPVDMQAEKPNPPMDWSMPTQLNFDSPEVEAPNYVPSTEFDARGLFKQDDPQDSEFSALIVPTFSDETAPEGELAMPEIDGAKLSIEMKTP